MARFWTGLLAAGVVAGGAALAAGQGPPAALPVRYDGHAVVRVEMESLRDVKAMLALSEDPWTCGWDGVSPGTVEFRVTPEAMGALRESGLAFSVMIEDVQRLIDAERRAPETPTGVGLRGTSWYDDYQPLNAISAKVDELVGLRPELASRVTVGTSLEARTIFAIRVNGGPAASSGTKPSVVINHCQHAREWITPMAGMYLAERLVTGYASDARVRRVVDAFDWYIVPVVNVDGYEHSWTTERLWRKNRRDNGDGTFGVDTNRNWGAGWGLPGASGATNSETYRGPSAFSEPETQAMRDWMLGLNNVVFHVDVHSFSQLILEPYGYQSSLPADTAAFRLLSLEMQEAMYGLANKVYNPGPIYRNIYPASGGSCDWTYDALGALGMSFELRDEGQTGFLLPADQIVAASAESVEGLLAAADRLVTRPLDVEFVDELPARVQVGGSEALRVRVARGLKRPMAGAPVRLWQRVGRVGPFGSSDMTVLGTDEAGPVLGGTLSAGAAACGAVVQYYIELTASDGSIVTVPAMGAARPLEAPVHSITPVLASTFDTTASATGWLTSDPTVGSADTAAAATRWLRGDPNGTVAQAEYDRTPLGGAACFYTGANAVGNSGSGDVDGGKTTLVSPVMNLSALADAEVSFWAWFSNNRNGGEATADDEFAVDITANGSAATPTWVRALTLTDAAPIAQATGVWRKYRLRTGEFIAPSAQVRLRFVASDFGVGSIVEAAVDDFSVVGLLCVPGPCLGDFNGNGSSSVQDLFDFLEAYFAGSMITDVNGSGGVSVEDLFVFLAAWFEGC